MATKKATKKGKTGGQSAAVTAMEVGAGVLAAAAAAGAGYYFYGDKNAKKHRAAASKWAKGMKADVVKEAKKLKKLDQKAMAAIVDRAASAYSSMKSVDKADITRAAAELKKNWQHIEREVRGMAGKARPAAKKAVTKTTKAVKKSAGVTKKAAKKAVKQSTKRSR
ncbi:MAG: hypothetical protein V4480_03565 [Patescibacteria group bacterium]